MIGSHKSQLETPCLLIDYPKLKYNLVSMQTHVAKHQIHYRPHCKTHKSTQLAKLQLEHGAIGLSVTTFAEAQVLISHDIGDILITSPVTAKPKLKRLPSLLKKSPSLMLVLDNVDNIIELNQIGHTIGQKIKVLLDVDAGIGRTGVDPKLALEYGQLINSQSSLELCGIQCYAGHLQHIHDYAERKTLSLQVMENASHLVKQFRAHHLPCPILTGTGTGTFDIDVEASEVTEIQPGSYVVMDVEYQAIEGLCHFKPAMTLLTTVISRHGDKHVTADAGTKSIYFNTQHQPKIISHPGLSFDWAGFGDEHGKVTASKPELLPAVGDVLELVVPHCDPTINLYHKFYVLEDDIVKEMWNINMR